MSKQEVVERILSDAKSEAEATIKSAEEKAAALKAVAHARVETLKKETEEENGKALFQIRRYGLLQVRSGSDYEIQL